MNNLTIKEKGTGGAQWSAHQQGPETQAMGQERPRGLSCQRPFPLAARTLHGVLRSHPGQGAAAGGAGTAGLDTRPGSRVAGEDQPRQLRSACPVLTWRSGHCQPAGGPEEGGEHCVCDDTVAW